MKIAMTFPGQGSQSVGMLAELAAAHPQVRETFTIASEVLGYDLWELSQNGPEADLNATERTQPAMLAGGTAVYRVWRGCTDVAVSMMAGHSLGEYTALVCAEALSFEEAVALVAERGRYMQDAVPQGAGAIAAVLGLDDALVEKACMQACENDVVAAVNFNAPGQVAIAGHTAAVERAIALAERAGAKRAIRLPLSVPVHCELMRPAAERFAQRLAETAFAPPKVPVVHNVDVKVRDDVDDIRRALAEQVYKPVRWADTVRTFAGDGVDVVLELGPGKVLSGLARRIDRSLSAFSVADSSGLEKALQRVSGT